MQTIPDWYKMDVADSHIYNMCGDGWTIDVIKHIFKGIRGTKIMEEDKNDNKKI